MCVSTDFESHAAKHSQILPFNDMWPLLQCVGEWRRGMDKEEVG